jgi:hypothetical protein
MAQRIVQIPTKEIGEAVSQFTIGLATLSVHDRIEDASCAGSGTLMTIGRLNGLLTAAHVLDALPATGDIGIVRYQAGMLQKQVIKMENTDQVSIFGKEFGLSGPDLAFLRLPRENVGSLAATNIFYNVSKRRDRVLAKQAPARNYVDAIIGMVDQLTTDVAVPDPLRRAKVFSALFCDGRIVSERSENGFDLVDFTAVDSEFPLPASFQGVGGGGLWRIYFVEDDGIVKVIERELFGVPFYESVSDSGSMTITCHGPNGIYGTLYEKVASKWPGEVEGNSN